MPVTRGRMVPANPRRTDVGVALVLWIGPVNRLAILDGLVRRGRIGARLESVAPLRGHGVVEIAQDVLAEGRGVARAIGDVSDPGLAVHKKDAVRRRHPL